MDDGLCFVKDEVLDEPWTMFFVAFGLVLSATFLPLFYPSLTTFVYLLFVAFLTLVPVEWSRSRFVDRFVRLITDDAIEYFSLRVKIKDPSSLDPNQSYMIGFEPHSALPVALPVVFNKQSPLLPRQLKGVHGVSSSLCQHTPLVRHLWYWLGVKEASRASIANILAAGKSAVLCVGGVREIQYMRHDAEVLFLKLRFGFVKLAIQTGSPLLPVLAIGQTQAYKITALGIPKGFRDWLGRRTGVQPLYLLGRFGTPIPMKVPIIVAIGTPIVVPQTANPDSETIQKYLDMFIDQMKELFEENKAEVGVSHLQLEIM